MLLASLTILSANMLAWGQTMSIGGGPTPEESARTAWESNAIFNIGQHQSYGRLVLLGYAYQTYLKHSDTDPQKILATPKPHWNRWTSLFHFLEKSLDLRRGIFRCRSKCVEARSKGYEYLVHDSSRAEAESFELNVQEQAWSFGRRQLTNAWVLSKINPTFQLVLDTFWGKEFNALSSDSYDSIIQKNSTFGSYLELNGISKKLSGLDKDISALKTAFDEQNAYLNAAISKNRSLLQQLATRQDAFIAAYAKQQKYDRKDQDEITERQVLIDGARAGVYLVSTFIQLGGNPVLARQISTVGNAAVQIAQAVNSYTSTFSHLSSLGQAASSAILASSFLGAVMSIAALSANQESADEVILKELQALSRQIAQLSEEMHARFDRVDLSLNFIFKALSDDFAN